MGLRPLAVVVLGAGLGLCAFPAVRLKFSEGPTDLKSDHGGLLVAWCHPVFPPALKAAGVGGQFIVRFIVDVNGATTSLEAMPGDERFKEAALAAVARWKFSPLVVQGRSEQFAREVVLTFQPEARLSDPANTWPPYEIREPETVPPEERHAPDPVYPKYLGRRQLFGEVELNLGINCEGRVSGVEILRSTYPDFTTAALTAVDQWVFRPARAGRLPKAGEKNAVLSFVVLDNDTGTELRNDWPELNGITVHAPGNPKAADYFTEPPTPLVLVDPVYPAELRQRGVAGRAKAAFSVDLDGRVVNVAVVEATDPAFGDSLNAAVSAWAFKPLYRKGEKVFVDFWVNWQFDPPVDGSPDARLLALQAQGIQPVGAQQLDRIPGVLFRRRPVYPAVLRASHTAGEAAVEVVIDHNGQVCLPRVVKASAPEFGWSAATAVSQWYFETPRRGGEPVDVKAVIPLEFKPD